MAGSGLGPFAGQVLARQVVGGEPFTTFSVPTDVFSFEGSFFAFVNDIAFANGPIGTIPAAGTNVVILRTFDNDNDATTPFNARMTNLTTLLLLGSGMALMARPAPRATA